MNLLTICIFYLNLVKSAKNTKEESNYRKLPKDSLKTPISEIIEYINKISFTLEKETDEISLNLARITLLFRNVFIDFRDKIFTQSSKYKIRLLNQQNYSIEFVILKESFDLFYSELVPIKVYSQFLNKPGLHLNHEALQHKLAAFLGKVNVNIKRLEIVYNCFYNAKKYKMDENKIALDLFFNDTIKKLKHRLNDIFRRESLENNYGNNHLLYIPLFLTNRKKLRIKSVSVIKHCDMYNTIRIS